MFFWQTEKELTVVTMHYSVPDRSYARLDASFCVVCFPCSFLVYFRRVHPGPAAAGRPQHHHPCSPAWRHLCGKNFQVHPLCLILIFPFSSIIVSFHTYDHSNNIRSQIISLKLGQLLHSFTHSIMGFEAFCLHMQQVSTLVQCCQLAVCKVKITQTGRMKENRCGKRVAVNMP
jgi:hypothetical protein